MITLPADTISIDPAVLIAILAVLVFFLLVGISVVLFHVNKVLGQWLGYLKEERKIGADNIKQDAYDEATKIMDEAREQSNQIINETTQKSKDILNSINNLSSSAKGEVEQELEQLAEKQKALLNTTTQELAGFYKNIVEKQKQESLAAISGASDDIKNALLNEVGEFENTLQKETVEKQAALEKRLEEEYQKIQGELEQYKRDRIDKIDSSIFEVLHEVTAKVLGKALSLEEHKQLVLDALNQAKSDKLLHE